MQPIWHAQPWVPTYYPFYVLLFIGLKSLWLTRRQPLQKGDLFFKALIPAAIAGAFNTVRTIPISDLFMAGAIPRIEPEDRQSEPDDFLFRVANPMKPAWIALCLVTTAIGAMLMTKAVPPEIAQGSKAFAPPLKAIAWLDKNAPKGNMLNLAHFGAVMIFEMEHNPPDFIDPRYNLFGNDLLQDYWKMIDCKDNWQQLMQHYKIDWTFLPPTQELSKRLAHDPDWQLLYSDDVSAIYARKHKLQ
jgi:hypothetical protein